MSSRILLATLSCQQIVRYLTLEMHMQLQGFNLVPFTFDKQVLLMETLLHLWTCALFHQPNPDTLIYPNLNLSPAQCLAQLCPWRRATVCTQCRTTDHRLLICCPRIRVDHTATPVRHQFAREQWTDFHMQQHDARPSTADVRRTATPPVPVSLLNVSDWQAAAAAASDPPCAHPLRTTSPMKPTSTHTAGPQCQYKNDVLTLIHETSATQSICSLSHALA